MIGLRDQVSACYGRLHRRAHVALLLATTALSSPLLIGSARAQNLPTGGSVAAGNVVITQPSATQLNMIQTGQSAVVNWQSFSIGLGSAVNIQQPNSTSAMLNRVTGNTPSSIAGSLTANGQVYLVNPNGIVITPTGVVNTGGGFVASTLGISDADFQSGKRTFTGNGASAAVSNAGLITVGRGGYAALLGGSVSNNGNIFVPLGKVGLGSGERATLDFSGDGFLQVALPTAAGGYGALIRNAGIIKADGGSVIISAATAHEAARNAVNMSGLVQARSIGGRSGSISIGGGAGGDINISGRLRATARRGSGGAVTVTGRDITLAGATVDVSGGSGGGTVNIGGGRQGQGSLQHADSVTIDKATTIRADATASGNGGNVVVWSDQLTRFAGTITARGGAQGGHGGEAEVSGKAKLDYIGFTDLSASHGAFGTLLLDPFNVIISNGAGNTGGSYDANANDSIINATILQTALGAAHVTITTGTSGSQAGNITVAAPLTWSTPTILGLNAAGGIAINAPISITGAGGLALNATAQAGITTTGLTFGNGGSVDYGAIDHGGTFSLNGNSYTLVYSMAQLDAIDAVNAVDGTALEIYGAGLAGNYALATNLSAAGTAYSQALIGTNSSGDVDTQFTGRVDGLGHTVTGLTINAPGTEYAALLGFVSGADASVSNIGLVGGSVTGQSNIGSLVGWLDLGTVQNSFSSAAVSGSDTSTGGLIGYNAGTVQSSYATGTVIGSLGAGGLVGWNVGTVQSSYAAGTVTGDTYTGGLTGFNAGTVQSSYATGAVIGNFGAGGLAGWAVETSMIIDSHAAGPVTGDTYSGGLIGRNYGSVNASHASGAVTGTTLSTGGLIGRNDAGTVTASFASGAVSGVQNTGGLIGSNLGTVETSYASGAVNATGNRTGGLIGQNGSPLGQSVASTVRASYATGAVTGTTNSGGLVGLNSPTGTVDSSYATGTVAGTAPTVGGLVGANNAAAGTVTNSYWDTQTSGLAVSAGGSGLTTAQLQGTLPAAFNAADWSIGTGLYPYLKWQFAAGTTPQSVSGIAYQATGTALVGATIAGALDGTAFAGTTSTGANGYYYFLLPQDSTAQGSGVFIGVVGNAVKANDYIRGAGGSVQNLDLNADTLNVRTDAIALSSLASSLAAAVAGTATTDLIFSTAGGLLTPNAGTGVSIAASGAFSVDQALTAPNALLLRAGGSLTVASAGSVSSSDGNVTLAGSTFANNAGAAAVSAPSGRWLIYSTDPASDTRGGLTYAFKQYGAIYGVTTVAQATGNGVLYSVTPTAGLTGTVSKTYDGDSSVTPGSFSVGITGYDQDVLAYSYSNLVYDSPNVGNNRTVTANGVAITLATDGGAIVYGYTSITMASGNIGTITARPITVTADAQSRVYGDANPALSYSIGGSGLVNGDSLSGGLVTGVTTATGVGSYGIAQGNLAAGSNYALTYAAANLTITARPLAVTADAQSRIYGDANPALSYSIGGSGLVNGDSLSGGLVTGATTATGVGSYGIAQGNLAAGSNYALTYAAANLTITARPLTVTADTQSRVYGDANPVLSYSIGGSGLVNGDGLSGGLATGATTSTGVGSYGIAQGNLTASSNYALTYAASNLTVAARSITVTADAQNRIFGDANPALTYAVGTRGLVNGDTLTGSLATDATLASTAGSYAIDQGTLTNALNPNYAIVYFGANLNVRDAPSPAVSAPTSAAPTFIAATPDTTAPRGTTINLQLDQPVATVIAPLTVPPVQVSNRSDRPTQTAARQNSDDDMVTGSITSRTFKSADGFVYGPLSQYDAGQYSGNTLPGFERQAGEAAIATMLLRGALRSIDTPKIDSLFDPGKGLQWKGTNWENPMADRIVFSDGTVRIGAPGQSFPIQPGTTDLAVLLGKGPVILAGSSNAADPVSFWLLAVAMTEQGIVANDPGTGRQVQLNYDPETKTLGSIAAMFDSKTGVWTKLADLKPNDEELSQVQLDQLAALSIDRFAAVSVQH
jgi:filamentous hemagglutinin family protein